MSTPEIIYLIPGEDIEGYPEMVWCESSAPSDHCDPDEAVKYVRADHIPDAGKVITDNSKVNAGLIAENERLQARLAELEGSEMTCTKTLVDIRFACGDDGKRMQGELVEYIAELSRKAVSVPSILYDGYAVVQEVQHARNSKGLEKIKDSALVPDVLDAVVKLIKQEQDQ